MCFVQRLGVATAVLLPVLFCGSVNGAAYDDPQLPEVLTYQSDTMVYTMGTPATPNVPISACFSGYSVSPALPEGLSLDVDTGMIDGMPTALAATATYTVTAFDMCSTSMDTEPNTASSATITITVNDQQANTRGTSKRAAVYAVRTPALNNRRALPAGV